MAHEHHHAGHEMTRPDVMDMSNHNDHNLHQTGFSFCGGGHHHHGMDGMNKHEGMAMYMDGFRSSLYSDSESTPCLNLFFPSWTLDTKFKFVMAMLAVLLLSILTEGFSMLRLRVSRRMTVSADETNSRRKIVMMLMHGIQAFMGYILMMATMTFSVELLICVCVGLGIGYGIFFDEDTGALHVTTNPCCSYMEGEALEKLGANEDITEGSNNSRTSRDGDVDGECEECECLCEDKEEGEDKFNDDSA